MFKKFLIVILLLLIPIFALPLGYFMLSDSSPSPTTPSKSQVENFESEDVITYLINLDRSVERYHYVLPSIQALGYNMERFSAVDGRAIPDEELSQYVDFDTYYKFMRYMPEKGTAGCSLSHFNVWERFLNSKYKYALVFEDDVSFDPRVLKRVVEELKQYEDKWDVVNLEVFHSGAPLTIQKLSSTNTRLSVYLTKTSHTGAYLINREGARKLLLKAYPINMPVDHYFNRTWELGIKFTGVEPRLVYQTFGDSEIEHTKILKPRENDSKFSFYLLKVQCNIMQFQTHFMRFFHNLKLYFELKG